MKIHRNIISLAVATGLVALAAQPLVASQPVIRQYFDYTLEPKSLPDNGGPVELAFSFKMKPEYECDSVLVQVGGWKGLVYDGPAEFWALWAETGEYSTTLSVTVPPNDTTTIFVSLSCPGCGQILRRTFITTEDTVSVLDYVPTPLGPEPAKTPAERYWAGFGLTPQVFDDTSGLTEEQLRTIHKVVIDLIYPERRSIVESLIGPIPDSAAIPVRRGAYILDFSLEQLLHLYEAGVEFDPAPEYREMLLKHGAKKPRDARLREESSLRPRETPTDRYWARHGLSKEMLEDRGSLTHDQLQTKHTVVIALRRREDYAYADSLLGPIPDTALIPGSTEGYILDVTLDHLLLMNERGVRFNPTPEYRERLLKRSIQLPVKVQPVEESSLPDWPEITLDHVDGELSLGEIPTGRPITFYLRMCNPLFDMAGVSNGFRIYSPDGAEWDTLSGDTVSQGWCCGYSDMFDNFRFHDSSVTGSDVDTVGFRGAAITTSGIPESFDEVSYAITIGPIDEMYSGRTICLDSSTYYGPNLDWSWVDVIGMKFRPEWYGPYCFDIVTPTIEFRGYARYWDMNPEADSTLPIRHAVIEMLDDEGVGNPELLASTTTDGSGYFNFPAHDNFDDGPLSQDRRDIFFRVYSENAAAKSYMLN